MISIPNFDEPYRVINLDTRVTVGTPWDLMG